MRHSGILGAGLYPGVSIWQQETTCETAHEIEKRGPITPCILPGYKAPAGLGAL